MVKEGGRRQRMGMGVHRRGGGSENDSRCCSQSVLNPREPLPQTKEEIHAGVMHTHNFIVVYLTLKEKMTKEFFINDILTIPGLCQGSFITSTTELAVHVTILTSAFAASQQTTTCIQR